MAASDITSMRLDDTSSMTQDLPRGHDWTLDNYIAILNFTNRANLQFLIMEMAVRYYLTILHQTALSLLIISTISSTLTVAQLSSDSSIIGTDTGTIVLQVIIAILSILTTILSGYLKISKINEALEETRSVSQRWLVFINELSGELTLPITSRTNALRIIHNARARFQMLCTTRVDRPAAVLRRVANLLATDDVRAAKYEAMAIDPILSSSTASTAPPAISFQRNMTVLNMRDSLSADELERRRLREKIQNEQLEQRSNSKKEYLFHTERLMYWYFVVKDLIISELNSLESKMKDQKFIGPNDKLRYYFTPQQIKVELIPFSQPATSLFDRGDNDSSDSNSSTDILADTILRPPALTSVRLPVMLTNKDVETSL